MSEALEPLTLDTITTLTECRLNRSQPKGGVSACLQSLDASFDPINRTWVFATGKVNQADEEDFAAEVVRVP